jgi:hypothetical protein
LERIVGPQDINTIAGFKPSVGDPPTSVDFPGRPAISAFRFDPDRERRRARIAWERDASPQIVHLRSGRCDDGVIRCDVRDAYLDLDPTYKDGFCNPLLRMTFDFHKNELDMSKYVIDRAADIARHMKPDKMGIHYRKGHYSVVPYQTTHNTGARRWGKPGHKRCQPLPAKLGRAQCICHGGRGAFPQNPSHNPTGTVGVLAYWAVDAITFEIPESARPIDLARCPRPLWRAGHAIRRRFNSPKVSVSAATTQEFT